MARNGTVDRIESAANITLVISTGAESEVKYSSGSFSSGGGDAGFIRVPISRLDTTKEIEISEIRESSLKANGYSITSISYSGTMMFKGSKTTKQTQDGPVVDLLNYLYDDHGVPKPVSISIYHELPEEPEEEVYQHVLASSESYEVRSESETETAFDWVGMDRKSDQPE